MRPGLSAAFHQAPTATTDRPFPLEAGWVLRHAYRIETERIVAGLRKLLGLANVSVEDPHAVVPALALHEAGLDFADALHLASATAADRFATFDNALARKARHLTPVQILQP